MTNTHQALQMIHDRGPRWAVIGTVRRGEHMVRYTDNADAAEQVRDHFNGIRYYQIEVHPPQDGVDLGALGRTRTDLKRQLDEATDILRAGVLQALRAGRAEAEVARTAGVDRMTVRTWAGK